MGKTNANTAKGGKRKLGVSSQPQGKNSRLATLLAGAITKDKRVLAELGELISTTKADEAFLRQPKSDMVSASAAGNIINTHICIYHLKSRCLYGAQCSDNHCKFPYQWVYKFDDSSNWEAVHPQENMYIELQYSDPNNDEYVMFINGVSVQLNFKTMKAQGGDKQLTFHRLSTETSAILDTQPLATSWVWFWKGPMGDWKKYGDLDERKPSMRTEYNKIENMFSATMPSTVTIVSISRVENGDLWHNYQSKKAKLKKRNKGVDVEERQLFHGTNNDTVEAIYRQGFDFRLSGTASGTAYGKGSYFATTAIHSDKYTDVQNGTSPMFIAKVLVGDYTKGRKSYTRPPQKDPHDMSSPLYDSCVNSVIDPNIFVIFELGQVYPEYLIRYRKKF